MDIYHIKEIISCLTFFSEENGSWFVCNFVETYTYCVLLTASICMLDCHLIGKIILDLMFSLAPFTLYIMFCYPQSIVSFLGKRNLNWLTTLYTPSHHLLAVT